MTLGSSPILNRFTSFFFVFKITRFRFQGSYRTVELYTMVLGNRFPLSGKRSKSQRIESVDEYLFAFRVESVDIGHEALSVLNQNIQRASKLDSLKEASREDQASKRATRMKEQRDKH